MPAAVAYGETPLQFPMKSPRRPRSKAGRPGSPRVAITPRAVVDSGTRRRGVVDEWLSTQCAPPEPPPQPQDDDEAKLVARIRSLLAHYLPFAEQLPLGLEAGQREADKAQDESGKLLASVLETLIEEVRVARDERVLLGIVSAEGFEALAAQSKSRFRARMQPSKLAAVVAMVVLDRIAELDAKQNPHARLVRHARDALCGAVFSPAGPGEACDEPGRLPRAYLRTPYFDLGQTPAEASAAAKEAVAAQFSSASLHSKAEVLTKVDFGAALSALVQLDADSAWMHVQDAILALPRRLRRAVLCGIAAAPSAGMDDVANALLSAPEFSQQLYKPTKVSQDHSISATNDLEICVLDLAASSDSDSDCIEELTARPVVKMRKRGAAPRAFGEVLMDQVLKCDLQFMRNLLGSMDRDKLESLAPFFLRISLGGEKKPDALAKPKPKRRPSGLPNYAPSDTATRDPGEIYVGTTMAPLPVLVVAPAPAPFGGNALDLTNRQLRDALLGHPHKLVAVLKEIFFPPQKKEAKGPVSPATESPNTAKDRRTKRLEDRGPGLPPLSETPRRGLADEAIAEEAATPARQPKPSPLLKRRSSEGLLKVDKPPGRPADLQKRPIPERGRPEVFLSVQTALPILGARLLCDVVEGQEADVVAAISADRARHTRMASLLIEALHADQLESVLPYVVETFHDHVDVRTSGRTFSQSGSKAKMLTFDKSGHLEPAKLSAAETVDALLQASEDADADLRLAPLRRKAACAIQRLARHHANRRRTRLVNCLRGTPLEMRIKFPLQSAVAECQTDEAFAQEGDVQLLLERLRLAEDGLRLADAREADRAANYDQPEDRRRVVDTPITAGSVGDSVVEDAPAAAMPGRQLIQQPLHSVPLFPAATRTSQTSLSEPPAVAPLAVAQPPAVAAVAVDAATSMSPKKQPRVDEAAAISVLRSDVLSLDAQEAPAPPSVSAAAVPASAAVPQSALATTAELAATAGVQTAEESTPAEVSTTAVAKTETAVQSIMQTAIAIATAGAPVVLAPALVTLAAAPVTLAAALVVLDQAVAHAAEEAQAAADDAEPDARAASALSATPPRPRTAADMPRMSGETVLIQQPLTTLNLFAAPPRRPKDARADAYAAGHSGVDGEAARGRALRKQLRRDSIELREIVANFKRQEDEDDDHALERLRDLHPTVDMNAALFSYAAQEVARTDMKALAAGFDDRAGEADDGALARVRLANPSMNINSALFLQALLRKRRASKAFEAAASDSDSAADVAAADVAADVAKRFDTCPRCGWPSAADAGADAAGDSPPGSRPDSPRRPRRKTSGKSRGGRTSADSVDSLTSLGSDIASGAKQAGEAPAKAPAKRSREKSPAPEGREKSPAPEGRARRSTGERSLRSSGNRTPSGDRARTPNGDRARTPTSRAQSMRTPSTGERPESVRTPSGTLFPRRSLVTELPAPAPLDLSTPLHRASLDKAQVEGGVEGGACTGAEATIDRASVPSRASQSRVSSRASSNALPAAPGPDSPASQCPRFSDDEGTYTCTDKSSVLSAIDVGSTLAAFLATSPPPNGGRGRGFSKGLAPDEAAAADAARGRARAVLQRLLPPVKRVAMVTVYEPHKPKVRTIDFFGKPVALGESDDGASALSLSPARRASLSPARRAREWPLSARAAKPDKEPHFGLARLNLAASSPANREARSLSPRPRIQLSNADKNADKGASYAASVRNWRSSAETHFLNRAEAADGAQTATTPAPDASQN